MATISRFEEIESWQLARDLTRLIYQCSSTGEFTRDFSLKDQIHRASVSVLSNIAEGFERGGNRESIQFLALAKGSCGEVRAQLYVALDQAYISKDRFDLLTQKAVDVSRLLSGLLKYLGQSEMRGSKFKRPIPFLTT